VRGYRCVLSAPVAGRGDVRSVYDSRSHRARFAGKLAAIAGPQSGVRVDLSPGMGLVIKSGERFEVIECPEGAVLLLVEAQWLDASSVSISTPRRVAGWPEEG
jgi:hypothetical protein